MSYDLGIDVGTTFTAAAISRQGSVEAVALTTYQVAVPSVIFADGNDLLFGGAAERRGATQPNGLAREFKRRVGDPVPLMLSGSPYHADRLTALMAQWASATVAEQLGAPADRTVITHPANWTEYQLGTLRNALVDVGLGAAELLSEPAAAAVDYAAAANLATGSSLLVYDLGGGTFDVALLRRVDGSFEHIVEPSGIERLGGIDFDEAVFQFAIGTVPRDVIERTQQQQQPEAAAAFAQLRRRCVDAKEALSSDPSADIPIMLPDYTATVRITRPEFESMVRPTILQTTGLVNRTIERAGVDPGELDAVLLVGGSSRIPLVSELVAEQLGLPVRVDAHPKLVTAKGAARRAADRTTPQRADDDRGRRRRGPLILAGAGALAAVAALLFVMLGRDDGPERSTASDSTPVSATGGSTTPPEATTTTVEVCDRGVCQVAAVTLPLSLDFVEPPDAGGIVDRDGQGTGFRLVQESSFGAYRPELLDVDNGRLAITTTNGIQFLSRDETTPNGAGQNALDNALGVAFDASSAPTVITATILGINGSLPGQLQQAGLWFGPSEDDYVKLNFIQLVAEPSAFRVQFVREVSALVGDADQINPEGTLDLTGRDVTLRLAVDPARGSVSGDYSLDAGATWTEIGSHSLPSEFFSSSSEAGIYATKRNVPESTPLEYQFDEFTIRVESVSPSPPTSGQS